MHRPGLSFACFPLLFRGSVRACLALSPIWVAMLGLPAGSLVWAEEGSDHSDRQLNQEIPATIIALAISVRTFWWGGFAAPPKCPCPKLAGNSYNVPAITTELFDFQLAQSDTSEADNLFEEGRRLLEEGSADSLRQAIQVWQQAKQLYQQAENQEGVALSFLGIGGVYLVLGDYGASIEPSNQALLLFRALGDQKNEATALNNIGYAYAEQRLYEETLVYYQHALEIRRDIKDIRPSSPSMKSSMCPPLPPSTPNVSENANLPRKPWLSWPIPSLFRPKNDLLS